MAVITGAQMSARIAGDIAKTIDVAGSKSVNLDKTINKSIVPGTSDGQANILYTKSLAIAASGTGTIDLVSALVDAMGDSASFTKIKGIIIHNCSNTQALVSAAQMTLTGNFLTQVFGASSSWVFEAGDWMMGSWTKTGKTATNTTQDTLTFTNNSGTEIATIEVSIIGV